MSIIRIEDPDGNLMKMFIFTDDESLRGLKKQFFDMDVYTDVITFNLEDEGEPLEGEIYISWDRVKDNAIKNITT